MDIDRKTHWETVYETKKPEEVSWTQEVPKTSLDFIHSFRLDKSAKIIDVGGGDSKLVDHLLDEGFENITVLDISAKALERAKERLGNNASKVNWIVCDINDFKPETTYNVWHDRAAFHFLSTSEEIDNYVRTVRNAVTGFMVVGTFSEDGPIKCSGLAIQQYNEENLEGLLINDFDKIRCIKEDHITPFGTRQNFLFCCFKKQQPHLLEKKYI